MPDTLTVPDEALLSVPDSAFGLTVPDEAVSSPTDSPNVAGAKAAWQAVQKPLIPLPEAPSGPALKAAFPFLGDKTAAAISGIDAAVLDFAGGLESPLGLATMGAAGAAKIGTGAVKVVSGLAAKAGAAYFGYEAAKNIGPQIVTSEEAFKAGDIAGGIRAALGAATSAVIAPTIAGHLAAPLTRPAPLVPFVQETARAMGTPVVPRGTTLEAAAAPLTAAAVRELPPVIGEIKTPEAPIAEDMGAVLLDAHEMAGAKVDSLAGFTDTEREIMRGKLEDWVREEAEKFKAANGTLDGFLPEVVIKTRVNSAIDFVRAQKRGGGTGTVPLDQPTEAGTVGDTVAAADEGPAQAMQRSEIMQAWGKAVQSLTADEQAAVHESLAGGGVSLDSGIADKIGKAMRGMGISDLSLAGPGGTVPADVGAAKSELNQLADSLPAAASAGRTGKSTVIPDVVVAIKTGLSKAQDAFHAGVAFLKGPPEFTDMQRAIGIWSRMRQESGRDVYFAWKKVQRTMPDTAQREAIGAYVDAGGDKALMTRAAAELPERYARNYTRALALTPDEIKVAENTRNYFDARLENAKAAGILEHGVENYIRRVFEKDSEWKDAKLAELRFLSTGKPGFARQRVFETDVDAAKAGLKPVQDFAQRVLIYDQELNRAIADRQFVKSLMARKMEDGRPMIDVAGTGTKIEGAEGDAILIKPQFKPSDIENPANNRTDYRDFNHPAFRKWKWVVDQDGTPVMVQGDVLVHPEAYKQMQKLLERSAVKAHPIAGPLLKISSGLKQTMLDLSGFHQVQIGVHALEHRVVPSQTIGNLIPIDLKNHVHQGLVEHGLTIFEESGFADFSEGLHGNSLIKKIPGIGPMADAYHNWLFKEFIPTVKMTMAVHALERNRAAYPKLDEDQLLRLTAEQSNAAFGGQNWKMLGRSETEVDLMRLAFLAPDFLVSRAKFVGQAGKPLGREQLTALFLGAAALYTTARVANQIVSGNPHWEKDNAFSVVYNNHAYGLRTVQGDILHLLEAPGTFWYHRVNPLVVQPLIELLTGRNYFGAKVTPVEVGLEMLKKPIPISLAGLVGGKDQSLLESALNAFGIQTKRFSASTLAYQMAADWKEKNKIKGDPGEFIYDPKKDPLHSLKSALQYQDTAKAGEELAKVVESGDYTMAKLNSYFSRYRNAPFTGSRSNDAKFIASLNEGEKKTVEEAQAQRRKIFEDFQAAKSLMPVK